MLVGVISSPELLPVEPPVAEHAAPGQQSQRVILLAADGRLAFEGQTLDRPALTARLTGLLSEDRAITVELKADAAVTSAQVIAVLDALRAAGIEQATLVAVGRRASP